MRHLGLTLLIQMLVFLPAAAQVSPTPAEVLRAALKAVEQLESVEYEVRREYTTADDRKLSGRTRIVAARSPLRFSAKLEGEDTPGIELVVSDGKVTRSSERGKVSEGPVFSPGILQVTLNSAHSDVIATLRLLLDHEYLQTALASQNILLAGQDEIEGELCQIVIYVRTATEAGNVTDFYWISAQSRLPRAAQRLRMIRGQSMLTPRFIISNLKLNPNIPPDTFLYQPKASDSTNTTATKNTLSPAPKKRLSGTRLPDLELRDVAYKPVKLSELKGQPTLITFWAPWCGPCLAEFPILQRLQDGYKGKLKIVAIAVQDSRLNVLEFIKRHPAYKFSFLSDAELPEKQSRLITYFNLSIIPTSVFIDSQGKVIDHWDGFENEPQLVGKIRGLMKQ